MTALEARLFIYDFGWRARSLTKNCSIQELWIDLGGTNEEEAPDNAELDVERKQNPKKRNFGSCLDDIE